MEIPLLTCIHCGLETAPGKRCSHCQFPLNYDQAPVFQGNSWTPAPLEFAVRIQSGQLVQRLSSELSVDQSQVGLLLDGGRLNHVLEPGSQTIASPLERLKDWLTGQSRSVVLARRTQRLSVLGQVRSKDSDRLQFRIELSLQLAEPEEFYVQLMQQSSVVSQLDLLRVVAPSVRRAIAGAVAHCGSAELHRPDPELLERLADETFTAATVVAGHAGFSIAWVGLPEFTSEDFDRYSEEQTRLRHNLRDQNLQQTYEEELNRIETRRFRAAQMLQNEKLRGQIADAERADEFDKLKSELRQRADLRQLNLQDYMEQAIDAWQTRRRQRQETQEDAVSLRAFLMARLELQRGQELATLQFQLDQRQLEQRTDLDAHERTARLQAAEDHHRAELRRLEMTRAFEMNGQLLVAQTAAEVTQIEVTRLRSLQELQTSHLDTLLGFRGREQKLQQDAADAAHRRKIEELEALTKSPEIVQLLSLAELAAKFPHMTTVFADALRLAQSRGLTPEQLQILAAERSPAVAETLRLTLLQERQRSLDQTQQQLAALERVIETMDKQRLASDQQQQDFMNRLERTGLNAQQMLRDLGVAAAGAGAATLSTQGKTQELTAIQAQLQDQLTQLRRRVAELEAGC